MSFMRNIAGLLLLAVVASCPNFALTRTTGPLVGRVPDRPDSQQVTAVVYLPDGQTVIAGGLDGKLRSWDAVSGEKRLQVEAHVDGVYSLALAPDGRTLASGGGDKLIRLWKVDQLTQLRQLEGHDQEVAALAFAPDGKTLASGSYDGTACLWDAEEGTIRHTLKVRASKVTSVAFAPDGKTLASGGVVPVNIRRFRDLNQSDQVRLWDCERGQQIRALQQRGQNVLFTPDGRTLISAGLYFQPQIIGGGFDLDGEMHVDFYDRLLKRPRLSLADYWVGLALSRDGRWLATGWGGRLHMGSVVYRKQHNEGIHLWESATAKEILNFHLEETAVSVMAFAPDDSQLAVGRSDGTVRFYPLRPRGWQPPPAKQLLTNEEMDALWKKLAEGDAPAAYSAVWTLAACGEQATRYCQERLHPLPSAGPRLQQLIADLDSEQFAVREAATKELAGLGQEAVGAMLQAMNGRPALEARRRMERLLEGLCSQPFTSETLRQERAIGVLERIGTKAAREILRTLAGGPPESTATQEASAALRRLGKDNAQ
jgi:WD40 repeat protein